MMNERITELAWQAKRHVPVQQLVDPEFLEKFAELIVKECAMVANRAENSDTEFRGMYDIVTEHFGVK